MHLSQSWDMEASRTSKHIMKFKCIMHPQAHIPENIWMHQAPESVMKHEHIIQIKTPEYIRATDRIMVPERITLWQNCVGFTCK